MPSLLHPSIPEVRMDPGGYESIPDEDIGRLLGILIECVTRISQTKMSNDGVAASGLPALDAHLTVLGLSVTNLEQRMRRHVSEQRQRRNQHAPIHCLPIELLTHIFRLYINETPKSSVSPCRNLHNLAQVSAQWRNLVKRSPALVWSPMSTP
ncbi:hypothetical protein FRB93_004735 [Tulasnella sp. JGI-2019a]|nr:hypothetical protein FRB93_004735 [Tulasnella sp. JGI-2019a]